MNKLEAYSSTTTLIIKTRRITPLSIKSFSIMLSRITIKLQTYLSKDQCHLNVVPKLWSLCCVLLCWVLLCWVSQLSPMYWILFMLRVVMLSVTLKSNVLNFVYAECRYTDCRGTSTISSICYNLLLQTHVINLTISHIVWSTLILLIATFKVNLT